MAFFPGLDANFRRFIGEQKVFFVATAPREGRVNVSPKGLDTLIVIDEHTLAYLDLTGSGNETAAHIEDNGRLTVMFCSFDEKPLILRVYGTGEVVHPRDPHWPEWCARFAERAGTRQVIVLHVESVQTSCGWAVPRYELIGERATLEERTRARGPDSVAEHWRRNNQTSIDGLPTRLLADD